MTQCMENEEDKLRNWIAKLACSRSARYGKRVYGQESCHHDRKGGLANQAITKARIPFDQTPESQPLADA